MQFIAITVAALVGLASALPADAQAACKPATYRCDPTNPNGKPGWDVCNTSGQWVFAGNCPDKTICRFDNQNGSPYCVPPTFPTFE